jgi:hypothetical protein
MNYEDFDLDNRTCVACGLPEVVRRDPLCGDGAYDEALIHARCYGSPAAIAWRSRRRKLDPAYASLFKWMVHRATIDCAHCGRKLEMTAKAIGMGGGQWGVHCTRCHRTSRNVIGPYGDSAEAFHAIESVRHDFVRSLNLDGIDRRMHEITRKYNYLAIHGLCECGGPYSLEAKARCPYCQHVAVDSCFHYVDEPWTPQQRSDLGRGAPLLPPRDWNDTDGWTRYYGAHGFPSINERELGIGGRDVTQFPRMFREWWQRGWWKVWFPGCGISALPKLLASFGFIVHATDVAEPAILFQNYNGDDTRRANRRIRKSDPALPNYTGELVAKVHDMRTSYLDGFFDVVVNINAFAGFQPEDMRPIARSHHAALKPRGRAVFEVVSTDLRLPNDVEGCLAGAGFHVPNFRLNRRARGQLASTGIPHVFLLGRPIIPRLGVYEDDRLRKRDTLILREIISRYAPYAKGVDSPPEGYDAKTAVVTYSHL